MRFGNTNAKFSNPIFLNRCIKVEYVVVYGIDGDASEKEGHVVIRQANDATRKNEAQNCAKHCQLYPIASNKDIDNIFRTFCVSNVKLPFDDD